MIKKNALVKKESKDIKKLISRFVENSGPVVGLLIAGVGLIQGAGPFVQFGITGVQSAIKLYISRAKYFESKLDDKILNNFNNLISQEDFAAKILRIWNAVQKEHQNEKIRIFAEFFNNTYKDTPYNEYDEYLNMLEDLSVREMRLLIRLDEFHTKNKDLNPHEERVALWDNFELENISKELGLSKQETKVYYDRLLYKGMCSEFSGFFGQVFSINVSPLYKNLLSILNIQKENN